MQGKPLGLDSLENSELTTEGTCIETADVEWNSDDPDPVAISRLKKASIAPGILEERVSQQLL